jgi:hypothetical protein
MELQKGISGQRHAPAALPPGKAQIPIVQEAWLDSGPVRMARERIATTGIRSPNRTARNSKYAVPGASTRSTT